MFKNIFAFLIILFTSSLIPNLSYSQVKLNINNRLNLNPGDFNFGNWFAGTKNFAEVTYGFGSLKHSNIKTQFYSSIIKEFKFGKRYLKPVANYKLIEFSDNYLFSSYIEDNQSLNSSKTKNISYDIWRFGFGYRKGYGYNFDSFAILPYYHMGLVWNEINLNLPNLENTFVSVNDLVSLRHYEDQIKFGTTNIGGVDVRVSSLITIGSSFETSIIFPYHLVWKQLGGYLIETLSQTGLDYLTEGVIIKAIPDVTPIVYFILKNGLSYFFYTLKQDDMNWPFNTVSPLTQEVLKFNVKITF